MLFCGGRREIKQCFGSLNLRLQLLSNNIQLRGEGVKEEVERANDSYYCASGGGVAPWIDLKLFKASVGLLMCRAAFQCAVVSGGLGNPVDEPTQCEPTHSSSWCFTHTSTHEQQCSLLSVERINSVLLQHRRSRLHKDVFKTPQKKTTLKHICPYAFFSNAPRATSFLSTSFHLISLSLPSTSTSLGGRERCARLSWQQCWEGKMEESSLAWPPLPSSM